MPDYSEMQQALEVRPCTAARLCAEIARIFHVQPTEVGLLVMDESFLEFLYPSKLRAAGMIPLSSSAVAARTAVAGKGFLFNRFPNVPHHTVFERIKLNDAEPLSELPDPIQKLMSAPIIGDDKKILGVLQVSRKGMTAALAGPDFTEDELERLERMAAVIAPHMPELMVTEEFGARASQSATAKRNRALA
jgi:hypothetical protein